MKEVKWSVTSFGCSVVFGIKLLLIKAMEFFCELCHNSYLNHNSFKVHKYRCKARHKPANKLSLTLKSVTITDQSSNCDLLELLPSEPPATEHTASSEPQDTAKKQLKQVNTFNNSNNCVVDNRSFSIHVNYNVVSNTSNKLQLEDYIANHPAECIARYCRCHKCLSQSGLESSSTQLHHSAEKFVADVIKFGGLGKINKTPIAKIVGKNSVCEGRDTIASRIESSVTARERKKNETVMRNLCVEKPSDVYCNLERISDNLESLYRAIESHLKMGSACKSAFNRKAELISKKIVPIKRKVVKGGEIADL